MHSAIFGEKSRGILAYGLGPVLGLMSGPILAHAMGPVGRGQFAGVMQPITIAAAFASIGIPSAVAFFSASGTDVRACFRVGLRLCIIPATIVAAVMIWYAGIISERQGIGLAFVLSCWSAILLSAVVQIRRGSWQGVGRWRILDTERATGALLRFIFVVVVALLGATSAEYFVAAALASFAIAASLLFRRLPKTRFDSDVTTPPNRKAVAKYAIFASVGTIATIASSRLDQLLMPAASTSAELGYYAIAVTVAEIPLVLATLAARNALPSAARGAANSKIFRDASLFFVVCVVSVVGIVALAGPITPIVFGADFAPSVVPMQILAISSIPLWISVFCSSILSGRGYPGAGSVVSLTSLGVTAVAFVVLWDHIDSLVAAQISLATSAISAIVGAVMVIKLRRCRVNGVRE